MMAQRMVMLGLLPALVLVGGCVQETVAGETATYTYEWWLPAMLFVPALASLLVVWLIFRRPDRSLSARGPAIGFVIIALTFLAGGSWMLIVVWQNYVIVDDGHFKLHLTGSTTTTREIHFDDCVRIERILKKHYTSKGRPITTYYLACHLKSGVCEEIALGDLMQEAYPTIITNAERRGVPVELETPATDAHKP